MISLTEATMSAHLSFITPVLPLLLAPSHPFSSSRPKIHHARPSTRALSPRASAKTSPATEDALLEACNALNTAHAGRLDRYALSAPLFTTTLASLTALEGTSSGRGTGFRRASLASALVGTWVLVLTDAAAVIRNRGGLTGLPVPGHCAEVRVVLGPRGKAVTQECLRVGFVTLRNRLEGTWAVGGKKGTMLEVTYEDAVLAGVRLKAESKAVLETTFVGEKVRVGRSGGGEFYVFEKVGEGEVGAAEG